MVYRRPLLKSVLLSLVLLIVAPIADACSCGFDGGRFWKFSEGGTVAKGTVTAISDLPEEGDPAHPTMTVAIDDVVTGSFSHDVVVLEGDRGWDCLKYVGGQEYPIGSEHLFILLDDDLVQGLFVCGETSVRIREGRVYGERRLFGRFRTYSVDYDRFVRKLKRRRQD